MESADFNSAPNLESKIPLQSIFQTAKFMNSLNI